MTTSDIWKICNGINYIMPLAETAWRLTETLDITATRKLVDSFEEHLILKELIETKKPSFSKDLELHPLLSKPFQLPPLEQGSRFGSRLEPSLWYGSLQLKTAMAEKAYYRFNFLRASKADYGIVEIPLTAFSIQIKTEKGIKLTNPPFATYTNYISSAISYERSQTLGSAMRNSGVHAFNFQSARDQNKGINIGLFTPLTFLHKKPNRKSFQSWQCITDNNKKLIEFICTSTTNTEYESFSIDKFLIEGKLPSPAN